MDAYRRLCDVADQRGLRPELAVNKSVRRVRSRQDGTKETWRDVVLLSLTERGATVHARPLGGLDELDAAAEDLLDRLR